MALNLGYHWQRQAKRAKVKCKCGELFKNMKGFFKHKAGKGPNHGVMKIVCDERTQEIRHVEE